MALKHELAKATLGVIDNEESKIAINQESKTVRETACSPTLSSGDCSISSDSNLNYHNRSQQSI